MPDYDELIHMSSTLESEILEVEDASPRGLTDYFALAVTTFGVGYLPLAPGTWGSAVGVLIYLGIAWFEQAATATFGLRGVPDVTVTAWVRAGNFVVFLLFCLLGIWASGRSTRMFRHKDPSQAVVDEVMGQLIVFLFVPFGLSWPLILAGFILFRVFDIWKPYPIDSLQGLPAGIGVCADDIVAGVYGGAILAVIHAVTMIL